MLKSTLHKILVSMLLLLLTACGSKPCIDADDWGYPKVEVPASRIGLIDAKLDILGVQDRQDVEPADSGQVIIDADSVPLVIAVDPRDQWTSWLGGAKYDWNEYNRQVKAKGTTDIPVPRIAGKLDYDPLEAIPDRSCEYFLADGFKNNDLSYAPVPAAPAGFEEDDRRPGVIKAQGRARQSDPVPSCPGKTTDGDGKEIPVQISNPNMFSDCKVFCWMREGMGLYVGLSPNNGKIKDINITKHIPDSKKPDVLYDKALSEADNYIHQEKDGYLVKGFASSEIDGARTGDKLYFKIVDRHYNDNHGGYIVRLKEGTRNPEPGPLEKIVKTFVDPMNHIMRVIFEGVTTHQDYISAFRAALAIYIILYGFLILFGGIDDIRGDAVMRMLKISVVVVLISPSSWEFFYSYLFGALTTGIDIIATMLISPFGDFDPTNPWYAVDELLRKLWSRETWAKILSTLLSNGIGILYILIMLYAMVIFLFALLRALVNYIISVLAIGVLIMTAPFFIVFILFEKTKSLFDEWLQHFFGFAVEIVILFAALGMFSMLIVTFLQQSIGYRVCWERLCCPTILGFDIIGIHFWMPDTRQKKGLIWMDANRDGLRETDEFALRVIDVPYFDPGLDEDAKKIQKIHSGNNFLEFTELLVFLLIVFLMQQFMEFVPKLAMAMKGGGSFGDLASIFDTGKKLWQNMVKASVGDQKASRWKGRQDGETMTSRVFRGITGRQGGMAVGLLSNIDKFISKDLGVEQKLADRKAARDQRKEDIKNGVEGAGGRKANKAERYANALLGDGKTKSAKSGEETKSAKSGEETKLDNARVQDAFAARFRLDGKGGMSKKLYNTEFELAKAIKLRGTQDANDRAAWRTAEIADRNLAKARAYAEEANRTNSVGRANARKALRRAVKTHEKAMNNLIKDDSVRRAMQRATEVKYGERRLANIVKGGHTDHKKLRLGGGLSANQAAMREANLARIRSEREQANKKLEESKAKLKGTQDRATRNKLQTQQDSANAQLARLQKEEEISNRNIFQHKGAQAKKKMMGQKAKDQKELNALKAQEATWKELEGSDKISSKDRVRAMKQAQLEGAMGASGKKANTERLKKQSELAKFESENAGDLGFSKQKTQQAHHDARIAEAQHGIAKEKEKSFFKRSSKTIKGHKEQMREETLQREEQRIQAKYASLEKPSGIKAIEAKGSEANKKEQRTLKKYNKFIENSKKAEMAMAKVAANKAGGDFFTAGKLPGAERRARRRADKAKGVNAFVDKTNDSLNLKAKAFDREAAIQIKSEAIAHTGLQLANAKKLKQTKEVAKLEKELKGLKLEKQQLKAEKTALENKARSLELETRVQTDDWALSRHLDRRGAKSRAVKADNFNRQAKLIIEQQDLENQLAKASTPELKKKLQKDLSDTKEQIIFFENKEMVAQLDAKKEYRKKIDMFREEKREAQKDIKENKDKLDQINKRLKQKNISPEEKTALQQQRNDIKIEQTRLKGVKKRVSELWLGEMGGRPSSALAYQNKKLKEIGQFKEQSKGQTDESVRHAKEMLESKVKSGEMSQADADKKLLKYKQRIADNYSQEYLDKLMALDERTNARLNQLRSRVSPEIVKAQRPKTPEEIRKQNLARTESLLDKESPEYSKFKQLEAELDDKKLKGRARAAKELEVELMRNQAEGRAMKEAQAPAYVPGDSADVRVPKSEHGKKWQDKDAERLKRKEELISKQKEAEAELVSAREAKKAAYKEVERERARLTSKPGWKSEDAQSFGKENAFAEAEARVALLEAQRDSAKSEMARMGRENAVNNRRMRYASQIEDTLSKAEVRRNEAEKRLIEARLDAQGSFVMTSKQRRQIRYAAAELESIDKEILMARNMNDFMDKMAQMPDEMRDDSVPLRTEQKMFAIGMKYLKAMEQREHTAVENQELLAQGSWFTKGSFGGMQDHVWWEKNTGMPKDDYDFFMQGASIIEEHAELMGNYRSANSTRFGDPYKATAADKQMQEMETAVDELKFKAETAVDKELDQRTIQEMQRRREEDRQIAQENAKNEAELARLAKEREEAALKEQEKLVAAEKELLTSQISSLEQQYAAATDEAVKENLKQQIAEKQAHLGKIV